MLKSNLFHFFMYNTFFYQGGNVMKKLLDWQSKKKVELIEKIFYSKNHSCTQSKLLKELNITYPTLRSLIDITNYDVNNFGYENFTIDHSPANQLYTLNMNEDCSIQLIINSYITHSSKFLLLEVLLTSSFPNLQSVAEKLFSSYKSVIKDIKELNKILEKYRIFISTRNGVRLEGDERGIRIFYTVLFLTVFGGKAWPFRFIRYFEISELLKHCPKEVYDGQSIDKQMLVHFYLAIHLLRIRQNNYIHPKDLSNIPLYKPYSEESRVSFKAFIGSLNKHVPHMDKEKLEFTTQIILSALLSFGSYTSIENVPPFFYSEPMFKNNNFLDIVTFICEEIHNQLSIPFSDVEKEKLIYSLMCVNYRYLLFDKINLNIGEMVLGYTKIDRDLRKRHKVKHLKLLIDQLMDSKELSIFQPYKKEISSDYLLIFEKRIDFAKHTLPIKVVILSIISNETAVANFFNFFAHYYNICVTNNWEEDIDLIISDIPLSNTVIKSFSIKQPIIYVHTRWSESDYEKINRMLAKIATDKFINKMQV